MRIRLQDIAEDLHLSKMTISRVLRGQTDVSADTKARVLKRMQELNYRPNVAARGLRTGQAYRVGVLVPRMDNPLLAAICQSLAITCQTAGYGLVMAATGGGLEACDRALEMQLSQHVDALFLVGGDAAGSTPETLRDAGVPVFYVGSGTGGAEGHSITLNESDVGRLPVSHLLSHGARRIAYLRGPRTAAGDDRLTGFLKAHQQAGVSARHEWIRELRTGRSEYESAREIVTSLLQSRTAPDAVMTNSDALAAGARDAALAHNLSLPDAFQVIGCGNDPQVCSIGPSLSSVDLRGDELGMRAARFALKVLSGDGSDAISRIRIPPMLVPRSTTRGAEVHATRAKGRGLK